MTTLIEGKTDLTHYLLAIQKRQLELASQEPDLAGSKKKHKMIKSKDAFKEANDVYAFGWGEWGQNGIGSGGGNSLTDLEVCPTPKLLESLLGKHVVQIAQGWSHTAVLLESGELLQYGNRIGTGLNEDYLQPTLTPGLTEKISIVSLACGAFHSAALTERGTVYTWGSSVNGQLGHGDRKDVVEPRCVEGLRVSPSSAASSTAVSASSERSSDLFVVQIACGSSFTAVLTDDATVYTWGCGNHGVLGHNDVVDRDSPTLVRDLSGTDIRIIAAGECHMFMCTSREVYGCGWNSCAQLGLGHEEDQLRPHIIESLRGCEVKEISAGATHSFALAYVSKMNQDILFSWGSNSCGQAGQGKKNRLTRPTPLPELQKVGSESPIVEIKCGAFHTLIRNSNGEVYATGSNKYGQCGISTKVCEQLDEFRLVEFLRDKIARSLCCGGENSSVLTARAWVEDSEATECMACKALFTFVNRKHHCRNCVRRTHTHNNNNTTREYTHSTADMSWFLTAHVSLSSSSLSLRVVSSVVRVRVRRLQSCVFRFTNRYAYVTHAIPCSEDDKHNKQRQHTHTTHKTKSHTTTKLNPNHHPTTTPTCTHAKRRRLTRITCSTRIQQQTL